MDEEGEEDEPEGVVELFCVRLVHKRALVEVGDVVRQPVELHLGGKQNHHQAAAEAADEVPEVESQGSVQSLVGTTKGVVHKEACGHRGEEDENSAEEDHSDMKTGWDDVHQVRKK